MVVALATAAIGAIFSSTAPDMGTHVWALASRAITVSYYDCIQGILDRYQQIQPKIIFSESEVVWAGKSFDVVPKVAEVARALDSHGLQRVVLLPSVATGSEPSAHQLASIPRRSVTGFPSLPMQ